MNVTLESSTTFKDVRSLKESLRLNGINEEVPSVRPHPADPAACKNQNLRQHRKPLTR